MAPGFRGLCVSWKWGERTRDMHSNQKLMCSGGTSGCGGQQTVLWSAGSLRTGGVSASGGKRACGTVPARNQRPQHSSPRGPFPEPPGADRASAEGSELSRAVELRWKETTWDPRGGNRLGQMVPGFQMCGTCGDSRLSKRKPPRQEGSPGLHPRRRDGGARQALWPPEEKPCRGEKLSS